MVWEDQEGGMYSLQMLLPPRCRDIKPGSGLGFYLRDLLATSAVRADDARTVGQDP